MLLKLKRLFLGAVVPRWQYYLRALFFSSLWAMVDKEKTFSEIFNAFLSKQESSNEDTFTAACSTFLQFESSRVNKVSCACLRHWFVHLCIYSRFRLYDYLFCTFYIHYMLHYHWIAIHSWPSFCSLWMNYQHPPPSTILYIVYWKKIYPRWERVRDIGCLRKRKINWHLYIVG